MYRKETKNIFYYILGINNEWKLERLTLKFEYLGGKHTGDRIKEHFDKVINYFGIKDKIHRIVTDQGKNTK